MARLGRARGHAELDAEEGPLLGRVVGHVAPVYGRADLKMGQF